MNIQLVDYLIDHLNININLEITGTPLFFRAFYYLIRKPHSEIKPVIKMIDFLILKGSDIDQVDSQNMSVFQLINQIKDNQIRELILIHINSIKSNFW